MLKRSIILMVLVLLLVVPVAQAQNALQFEAFQIDLWPEYDQPSVLVIYRAKLAADVSFPAEVTFHIPAAAGEPNAVAVRQMDGSLLNAAYERVVDGVWAAITFTATAPEVQLEYYDPQLGKEGDTRSFEYTWPGDYAVAEMNIFVQQPLGATSLSIVPNSGEMVELPGDPMQYYRMDVGAPNAGETVRLGVTYAKANDILSIESLQVQPSAPLNGQESGTTGFLELLPWILGGAGVILLVGGGLWYWRMNQPAAQPKATARGRRTGAAGKSPEQMAAANGANGDAIYCHQCGKRAAAGDRFCRTCGTKLRST